MIICITSQGKNLESKTDPRFGRCSYFILIDPEKMEFEAVENSNAQGAGGAGIQSGQLMVEKNVEVVLTGNVGPNAYQTLNAGGIRVITGISGSVQEVVEKYKQGQYKSTDGANVETHFGLK